MRAIAGVVAFAVSVALASAQAQETPRSFEAYKKTMRDAGFNALVPASSSYAPGYVYTLTEAEGGRQIVVTVCPNAFLTAPTESEIRLPSVHRFSGGGLSAGLNLAPGAVAPQVAAAFGAEFSRNRTVDVSFGRMRAFEVPQKAEYNAATGALVKRELNPACVFNLQSLPAPNGRFRDKVFIVVRSYVSDSYSYTLEQEAGANVNLTAGLEAPEVPGADDPEDEEVARARVAWKIKRTGNSSFEIERDPTAPENTRVYLAAEVVRLTSWDLSTQVSASPTADLGVAPADASDNDALGGQPERFKPVMADLVARAPRASANGGNAVVLLTNTPARRAANAALCQSLYGRMSPSSVERLRLARQLRGEAGDLRPVYWLLLTALPPAQQTCERRLSAYNFARASVMLRTYNITSAGPHLAVLRTDGSTAGTIDLTDVPVADYPRIVSLFRDGFSQEPAWVDTVQMREQREGAIKRAFSGAVPRHVQAAIRSWIASATGCRNDLTDSSCG